MRVLTILKGFSLAAVFAPACFGQWTTSKVVIWSGQDTCGWKSPAVEPTEQYRCFAVPTDRGTVSAVAHDGITLSVAFLDHDEYLIAAVQIRNSSREPVNFNPDSFGAAHFKQRKDFIEGKEPIVAETAIPTREKVRELSSQVRSANSAADFMADLQMTGETVNIRKADGSMGTGIRIVPDKQAKAQEHALEEMRSRAVEKKMEDMREKALTARYVAPGDSVKGLVYFRRVKKAEFVVFSFRLLETEYVFLLPKTPKPKPTV